MTTIYSVRGIFPIKIREAISTRFSGLIEYSATYTIEKGSIPAGFGIGTTIDTASGPATIFPGPRYSRSNDSPFDEMQVTAYGHSISTTGRAIKGTEILQLSYTIADSGFTTYETWLCETHTLNLVIASTSNSYATPTQNLNKTLIRRWIGGKSVNASFIRPLNIVWNTATRDVKRTNFGAWDEVAVMNGYVPEVLEIT